MIEPRPCPSCGVMPVIDEIGTDYWVTCKYPLCPAQMWAFGGTLESAVGAWNSDWWIWSREYQGSVLTWRGPYPTEGADDGDEGE